MTNTTKPHQDHVSGIKLLFALIALVAILGSMLPSCSPMKDGCRERQGMVGYFNKYAR